MAIVVYALTVACPAWCRMPAEHAPDLVDTVDGSVTTVHRAPVLADCGPDGSRIDLMQTVTVWPDGRPEVDGPHVMLDGQPDNTLSPASRSGRPGRYRGAPQRPSSRVARPTRGSLRPSAQRPARPRCGRAISGRTWLRSASRLGETALLQYRTTARDGLPAMGDARRGHLWTAGAGARQTVGRRCYSSDTARWRRRPMRTLAERWRDDLLVRDLAKSGWEPSTSFS